MGKVLVKYFFYELRAFNTFFISLRFIKPIRVQEINKSEIKDSSIIGIILFTSSNKLISFYHDIFRVKIKMVKLVLMA
jgi:hypothetical protein